MKFTLEIECDNDAFAGDPSAEVARILRDVAARIEYTPLNGRAVPIGTARDINGNRVGFFRFGEG